MQGRRTMSVKERVFDALLTIVVFSPLIVFYWSGTWQLLDLYLLPSNRTLSALVSVVISVLIMGTTFFVQDFFNKRIRSENHVTYVIVTRLYTYVTAFAFVNSWRGMWMILDIYTGVTFAGAAMNVCVGIICLVLMRSYRNVLAPPGTWALDIDTDTHFTVLTRFRTKTGGILYVLDVAFGIFVISPLVLLVWRGKWQLLQLTITPDSDLWRAVIDTVAAHVLMCVLSIIQYPARKLAGHLHTSSYRLQLVLEDIFVFVDCLTSVMYWQGVWNLVGTFMDDFDLKSTQWPLHFLGFGGLMSLCVCTTLQFSGFFKDGELPNGLGLVVTPTYLRTFWMKSNTVQDLSTTMHDVNSVTDRRVMDVWSVETHLSDPGHQRGETSMDTNVTSD